MGILHQDGAMKSSVVWSKLLHSTLALISYSLRTGAWHLMLGVSMAWCLYIAVFAAGFEGIKNSFGLFWAVVATATLFCRQPPIAFVGGAVIHAMNTWKWHPAIAILFSISPYIWMLSLACLYRLFGYIRRLTSPH
jgi:hypothetical protein